VKEAIGCAAVGSVATVAAVAVGGQNLVNIIAGGVVAPANPGVLYLGLVGVIFAAFCGIAENLMPIYLHATEPAPEPQVTPSKLPADGSKRAAGPTMILAASAQVSERLSAKFDQVAMWSGQTADGLGAQVSERLSAKFDQVAMWSGQIMKKLSVKADAVSVKAAEAALWSEQMIGRPAAEQKPAPSYLAAMLSAVHRVKAYGPMPDPVDHLLAPDGNSMSLGVKQAIACLGVGTAATAGAIAVGAENLTNLIAGGLVTAANPAVLYLGLTGIVFASFCAIGSALTPIYLYYTLPTSPHPGPGQNMANPSG
jgi:hypothetical protein